MSAVYIISKNGERFMPTVRYGHIRHLLKDGKAIVWLRGDERWLGFILSVTGYCQDENSKSEKNSFHCFISAAYFQNRS